MKYYNLAIKSLEEFKYDKVKICYIIDLFNGQDLDEEGKYILNEPLVINRNFYFRNRDFYSDFKAFQYNLKGVI